MAANTLYPDAPRVGVGAVVIHRQKVLLVLRDKAPSRDRWAIPGGSVELGETLQQAAEREIMEETGLHVRGGDIVHSFDAIVRDAEGRVQYHYVILDLEAELLDLDPQPVPGDDVRDARFFSLSELSGLELPVSEATEVLLAQFTERLQTG